jgi:peptidoglycan/LPS O-acetylase OafA/YrhL
LFPPLIVSVFGMWAVGNWSVGQMPAGTVASPFAVTMFLHNVAWDDIWLNSLLITTDINKVTWTVVVEFWGSLLLPVLLYGMARFNAWAVIFALLVMALIPHQLAGLAQLYCFACGAMIARHPWPDRLPAGWLAVASAAVLILAAEWPAEPWLRDMILTAGASGLIVAVLRRPFGLLSLRPLLALGEVSYSLYLLHPAALGIAFVAAARLGLLGAPGAWFLVVLSLAIAIPLAMLSRKYVELPAISLGRRLVERSRPIRHGATAQAVS